MTSFKIKYPITKSFLESGSCRRSGVHMPVVRFVVAHDSEQRGLSAQEMVDNLQGSVNQDCFSAHLFVDDQHIIESIPALSAIDLPEKANHVPLNVSSDNWLYGIEANDGAIGVVFCYGDAIDSDAAYKKYVWVLAYLCYRYGLDPNGSVIGHCFLDPQRKADPKDGLTHSNKSYVQLLIDVVNEYNTCIAKDLHNRKFDLVPIQGKAFSNEQINIYMDGPQSRARIVKQTSSQHPLPFKGWIKNGECIEGNQKWFVGNDGNYFWSGNIGRVEFTADQENKVEVMQDILSETLT